MNTLMNIFVPNWYTDSSYKCVIHHILYYYL